MFGHLQDYYDNINLILIKTGHELIESLHQYVETRMQKNEFYGKGLSW